MTIGKHLSPLTLYGLKRDFGVPVLVCVLDSASTDLTTGQKSENRTVYRVKRAPVLPRSYRRHREQDKATTTFIVESKDVPGLEVLTEDDWLLYDGSRYQVKEVERFDHGFVIEAVELVGEVPDWATSTPLTSAVTLVNAVSGSL